MSEDGLSVEELEQILPPAPLPSMDATPNTVVPGRVPDDLPAHIARMSREGPNEDRSRQTCALVRAAVEWGYQDSEVLALGLAHAPTIAKRRSQAEAVQDIRRLIARHRPDHQHVGKPCDKADCPNKPAWMAGPPAPITSRPETRPKLADAGEGRVVDLRPAPGSYFDERGIVPARLGAAVQVAGHVRLGTDGRLWRYHDGVYRPDGAAFAREQVRERLDNRFRRRHVDEVLAWLQAHHPTVTDAQPTGILNVSNGLLHLEDRKLEPHNPDIVSTVQLPVSWDPEADCPGIMAFLGEVLPSDAIDFMLELTGYTLVAGNPYQIAALLYGPGANGKGVLLSILRALVGAANVSSVTLQALAESRFAAAELFGKVANIAGDLDARAITRSDMFKMITGNDPITAERKFAQPFTFRPQVMMWFSANEVPLSSDQSPAWFRRWVVVPMERAIPPAARDPRLTRRLTTGGELSGLLVRAVDGLERLLARGRFDLPASVQKAGEAYQTRLDTVRTFVEEECVVHPDSWVPRAQLYKSYREWAKTSGRLAVSAQTFYEHLRRNWPAEIGDRTREGRRGFVGIGLLAVGDRG